MDLHETLNELVEIIKRNSYKQGKKISMGEIAERLDMSRQHLSALLHKKEEVLPRHIEMFHLRFQKELGPDAGRPAVGDPMNPYSALLLAIAEDYAEWKASVTGQKPEAVKAKIVGRGKQILNGLDSWLPQK
jgi:transcriptional regulator with XRE-family HTH domain